jgi:hypothetical protein
MVLAAGGAGAVIAICGGTYLGLVYLFDGLGTSKIALLVLGMMSASVGAVLLVLFILRSVWSIKHEHQQPKQQEAIQTSWSVKPAPQLSAPEQRIYVPVYSEGRKTKPLGAGIELRSSVDDVECIVKLSDALRFIQLPTPTRKEWSGKATSYGALMRWFQMQGWLMSAAGGVRWVDGFTHDKARAWLLDIAGEGETLPYSQMVSDE